MRRKVLIALSACSTAVFGLAQLPLDAIMRARGAGIVRFEFALTAADAQRIWSAWGERGQGAMRWSLLLDFPLLVSYGVLLAALAMVVAQQKGRNGWPFAGLAIAMAGCDVTENLALLMVTSGHAVQPFPGAAAVFALLKFLLLAFILGYLVMWTELAVRRERRAVS